MNTAKIPLPFYTALAVWRLRIETFAMIEVTAIFKP